MRFVLVILALFLPLVAQAQNLPGPRFRAPPANDNSDLGATTGYIRRMFTGTVFASTYLTDLTCATDQSDNVTTAAAAVPAGGRLVFPAGCVRIGSTVTNTSQFWEGAGRAEAGGTEFRYTNASGPAVKLMGGGARFSNFRMTHTVDPTVTAAVAIQMADGIQNPRGQMVDHVAIRDFRDQVDIQSGEFWSFTHFDLYRAKRYGMRIRNGFNVDSGDGSIVAGTIYTDLVAGGDAAIRHESGGGLKVSATKILQFARGVDLAIANDSETSDLFLDDSVSIEGQYDTAVSLGRISPTGNGKFYNIRINAQIAATPVSVAVHAGISNAVIGPIVRSTGYGVIIDGGDNITVPDGTVMEQVGSAAVAVNDPATNVSVGKVNCTTCVAITNDNRNTGAGPMTRYETLPINLPQSTSYKDIAQIDIPPLRGARISVQVEGVLQTVGNVNRFIDTLASNTGSAVSIPASLVDSSIGSQVDLRFDVGTVPGSVRIGVRPNAAAGGGNLQGSITIRVDGKTTRFKLL
ncbi:hypothetical protein ASG63_17425 [Methylobacterium sp. Leaf94]|uniref:hypothetical protein n=1 Tax=Methylobacterium sp. Leaf94 TaxID=1736250 RepID=UPI0006F3E787|nr:hypothetical protein [Methylobacterium sp. Leaf94]KQU30251.1 hypothetical protein ASG63_17425 [Methylobacterium sp. Leaf94]